MAATSGSGPGARLARRTALAGLAALAAAPARAQAPPLVVVLRSDGPDRDAFAAFMRTALREHGVEDGRQATLAFRWGGPSAERWRAVAEPAVAERPAVILAMGAAAATAVTVATATIPVVAVSGDLAARGGAAGAARTADNVTGISFFGGTLDPARLELLAELLPAGGRVLALRDANLQGYPIAALEEAARARGRALESATIRGPDGIEPAIAAGRATGAAGILVLSSAMLNAQAPRIVALAEAARLPAMQQFPESVAAGALIAYGPRLDDIQRQAAGLVAGLLRGRSPAELPVERPAKLTLAVNRAAARRIGLALPAALLARADQVVD